MNHPMLADPTSRTHAAWKMLGRTVWCGEHSYN